MPAQRQQDSHVADADAELGLRELAEGILHMVVDLLDRGGDRECG